MEIDPDHFNSLYNTGAIYYNKAGDLIAEAQELPLDAKEEYQQKLDKAKEYFKKALPYMEKAHELKPEDQETMLSLKEMYHRLKMYDKRNEIQKKLKGE